MDKKKKQKSRKRISLQPKTKKRISLQSSSPNKKNDKEQTVPYATVLQLRKQLKQLHEEIENLRPKHRAGRPSKLTPQVEHDVLTVLKLGLSYATAAKYVRVSESTLRLWRDQDDTFSAECEKAIADAVTGNTTRLQMKINDGNLTALIFWMKSRTEEFRERRYEIFQDAGEYDPNEEFL